MAIRQCQKGMRRKELAVWKDRTLLTEIMI